MRIRIFSLLCWAVLACVAAGSASAHRANESYVYFNVTDTSLSGRVEATLADVDLLVPLDADGDGVVTEAEFNARASDVYEFFAARLSVSHEGAEQRLVSDGFTFLETPLGTFAQVRFALPDLTPTPEAVEVSYRFPFDEAAPGHLGYALIESNTRTGVEDNEAHISLIFSPGAESQTLSLVGDPPLKVFIEFVVHGVWHIWLGFDHVVFLITLLLPAVMLAQGGRWSPAPDFRSAFITTIKVVTVFTLSHTITLSLSALGIFRLPVTLVEIVIAASIAIVALGNIFPIFQHRTLWIVFIFGLFHGFGFANVLAPLGVDPSAKVVGLAGFNIGVELGQIAIVIALFPILFLIRRWSLYPFFALRMASVGFILLAGLWLVERSSGVFWRLQQQIMASV